METTKAPKDQTKQSGISESGSADQENVRRGVKFSFTSFEDPDGNRWLSQEIMSRLPGRE